MRLTVRGAISRQAAISAAVRPMRRSASAARTRSGAVRRAMVRGRLERSASPAAPSVR
jgi:hypothetical protein